MNSGPSNIAAMHNLPQFAEIPQECTMLACPWDLGATSLLVAVPRLGGLGHLIFFQASFDIREAVFAASGAQGVLMDAA